MRGRGTSPDQEGDADADADFSGFYPPVEHRSIIGEQPGTRKNIDKKNMKIIVETLNFIVYTKFKFYFF